MSERNWNEPAGDGLGSLAQSARRTGLGQARGLLVVIGLLQLVVSGALFAMSGKMAKEEVAAEVKKLGPGADVDPDAVREVEEQTARVLRLVNGGFAALGAALVALGLAVYRAPVVCTVTGLVLYLAGNALTALFDPAMVAKGVIIKVFIVIAFVKAIQAAVAYQRETAQATAVAAGEPV